MVDEPLMEVMRAEKSSSRTPFVVGAAVLIVILIIAWFVVLLPKKNNAETEVVQKESKPGVVTTDNLVNRPVVVIKQSGGYIQAQEIRPLRLESGQYIYIVQFETDDRLIDPKRTSTRTDDDRVISYSYVPQ